LQFVYRTALVYSLGIEYAGITGLCQNVIGLFALSELGISWAISFYLYKPLKEKNDRQVAEIIYYLKRLYRYVGIFILIAGIAVLPFLDNLIKGGNGIAHLKWVFFLFVFNTSISYLFFSYYQILANADRKNYMLFAPQTLGNIALVTLQIIAVYHFHSFITSVALSTLSTLVVNYIIRQKIIRIYPLLSDYKNAQIEASLKKKINRYIKSTMLYKLSLTVMTSSTSIIISHYIGLAILGIYTNYMLIVDTIRSLILSMINPLTAVVGEITAGATSEEIGSAFKRLNFLMDWICYFCAISFYCLLTPFITLWIGSTLSLQESTVTLIAIYFYVEFIISFSTKFRDACGLNNIGKFRPLITAVVNVALAIILVNRFGINGIIAALLISRLTTLTWFEPWVIHKYVLKKSVLKYYSHMVVNILFTFTVAIFVKAIVSVIWEENILSFVEVSIITFLLPNTLFLIIKRKSPELKYYLIKLSLVEQ